MSTDAVRYFSCGSFRTDANNNTTIRLWYSDQGPPTMTQPNINHTCLVELQVVKAIGRFYISEDGYARYEEIYPETVIMYSIPYHLQTEEEDAPKILAATLFDRMTTGITRVSTEMRESLMRILWYFANRVTLLNNGAAIVCPFWMNVQFLNLEYYDAQHNLIEREEYDSIINASPSLSNVVENKYNVDSLEKVNFTELDSTDSCIICYNKFEAAAPKLEVVRLPCSHMFHGHCIVKWLNTAQTCPLCRFVMP